jgi:hypothetical protein
MTAIDYILERIKEARAEGDKEREAALEERLTTILAAEK